MDPILPLVLLHLEKALDQSGWTKLLVPEMRQGLNTVLTSELVTTTVPTVKMLGSAVKVETNSL